MNSRSPRPYVGFVLGLLLLGANAVNADSSEAVSTGAESEREVLARVVHELRVIEALIAKADQRKPAAARISFDYNQLLLELAAVGDGIEEYINGVRMQPRLFEPLKADYTRVKTQAAEGDE